MSASHDWLDPFASTSLLASPSKSRRASPSHHQPPPNPRTPLSGGTVDVPPVQPVQHSQPSPQCIQSLPTSATNSHDLPSEPGVGRANSVPLPQSAAPEPVSSPSRDPSPKPERTLRMRKSGCEDRTLTARPDGEVGRPGRGGYNLQKTLGLSDKEYKAFKVRYWPNTASFVTQISEHQQKQFNPIVDRHLDYSVVFVSQPAKVMKTVQDEILKLVPGFASYEDNWPVRDFIFARYQYQRQRFLSSQKRVPA
ncbi:hypothetical protein BDZ89DRAFT_1137706 [Hymenopellis radicata]|nr:hypothetical protein BDZ89DRAFT_1137706 [Hymenopellis radicata]